MSPDRGQHIPKSDEDTRSYMNMIRNKSVDQTVKSTQIAEQRDITDDTEELREVEPGSQDHRPGARRARAYRVMRENPITIITVVIFTALTGIFTTITVSNSNKISYLKANIENIKKEIDEIKVTLKDYQNELNNKIEKVKDKMNNNSTKIEILKHDVNAKDNKSVAKENKRSSNSNE